MFRLHGSNQLFKKWGCLKSLLQIQWRYVPAAPQHLIPIIGNQRLAGGDRFPGFHSVRFDLTIKQGYCINDK